MKAYFLYLPLDWFFTPILQFIEKYVYSDWEFFKFLFVITLVDTLLGVCKDFRKKEFSSRCFTDVFYKFTIYLVAFIVTHVLVYFSIAHKSYTVFNWMDSVV